MQEALTLFDSICNSRWFVKTSIILFLNKIDLFAEKLPRSPLGDYFPDYTGGDSYDAACDYLLHRFVSLNQSAATKQIYAHYTCATDTQQIKCECCWLVMGLSTTLMKRIQSCCPRSRTSSCRSTCASVGCSERSTAPGALPLVALPPSSRTPMSPLHDRLAVVSSLSPRICVFDGINTCLSLLGQHGVILS
jgi:hypothetical protein